MHKAEAEKNTAVDTHSKAGRGREIYSEDWPIVLPWLLLGKP